MTGFGILIQAMYTHYQLLQAYIRLIAGLEPSESEKLLDKHFGLTHPNNMDIFYLEAEYPELQRKEVDWLGFESAILTPSKEREAIQNIKQNLEQFKAWMKDGIAPKFKGVDTPYSDLTVSESSNSR